MTDTKSGDKTLSVSTKKTLTLKRSGVEQGTVRQNFSHGRTNAVVVETKKRKFTRPGEKPEPAPVVEIAPKVEKPVAAPVPAPPPPAIEPAPVAPTKSDEDVRASRDNERKRRLAAAGRQSTILTSPTGTGTPTTEKKTLLGS